MPQVFDVILSGGVLVNQDGEGLRDVGLRDGKIAEIGDLSRASAGETVDCRGLHILPGVIDTQVHFREPGAPHKEDLESGSRGAVLGGVVGVFDMPNTNPLTTGEAELADKLARATGRMHCDFAFWVGGTHENARRLGELERLPGAAGIKVFMGSSTGSLLIADDAGVAEVLSHTRRRAAFHSEDEDRLNIAREKGALVHVLHVTTEEEIALLAENKDIASVEVTPHHLTMDASDYARIGTRAQMNPPVREARHRDGLWRGVAQGVVDVLGSDHAPHTLEEKAKPYPESPSGMTGVQTLVPLLLDHVNAGRLTLQRFVDLTSAGPARLFGVAGKGRAAVGYDADLTIVDMKRRETIRNSWIASRVGWTPYDGKEVVGWPVGTFVRGAKVMWEGELAMPSQGASMRFFGAL
ncbi:MAG: amidohydrolase family protein [Alphaproteobacteria bacterium]|nr:amidohydrolase family protein [Alphaproteobacteria bacterium]